MTTRRGLFGWLGGAIALGAIGPGKIAAAETMAADVAEPGGFLVPSGYLVALEVTIRGDWSPADLAELQAHLDQAMAPSGRT